MTTRLWPRKRNWAATASAANRHRPPRSRASAIWWLKALSLRDARVVAFLTGHALKDTDAILRALGRPDGLNAGEAGGDSGARFHCQPGAGARHAGAGGEPLSAGAGARAPEVATALHFRFVNLELRGENLIERGFRRLAGDREFPVARYRSRDRHPLMLRIGSSAAAIAAGFRVYEAVFGRLPLEQLLNAGCELEGHPDNVAAALWAAWWPLASAPMGR